MRKITQTIVGTTPPLDKNVLWLDTTNSNEPVQKLFLNGEWKPLKDSDVDATFNTGEKVSDIGLYKSESISSDNAKIPSAEGVKDICHEMAQYINIEVTSETVEEVTTNYATGYYNGSRDANYVINIEGTAGKDADEIRLAEESSNLTDSVTTLRFKSTSTPTSLVYDEQNLLWANDAMPEIESGVEYIIAIWNKIAVITKIKTIPISNS